MTLAEVLDMTLGEALQLSADEDSPVCFTLGGKENRQVILVASGEDAEALMDFVSSKLKPLPPTERN